MEVLSKSAIHSIFLMGLYIYAILLFIIVPMLGVIRTSLWYKLLSVILITGIIFLVTTITLMFCFTI